MKKALSLLLALLTVLSVLTVSVSAAQTEPLLVMDLLKHDVDDSTGTCRTVEIFIQNQFRHYDSTKEITLLNAQDEVVAVCKPYEDAICKYDLYAPDGSFGVVFDPTRLYFLTIPEGAYYTDNGVLCAAYSGEYTGVYLGADNALCTIADLGLSDFLATNAKNGVLYAGRIRISLTFNFLRDANHNVKLLRKNGEQYVKVGDYKITAFKKGRADITFGGVKIDRYASYKLHVDYGTFTGSSRQTINDHCDYIISGKKLLGLREDYPELDLLIRWFGADHWTLKTIVSVMNLLSKVGLVDAALAKDVRNYVNARKKA